MSGAKPPIRRALWFVVLWVLPALVLAALAIVAGEDNPRWQFASWFGAVFLYWAYWAAMGTGPGPGWGGD